MLFLSGFIMTDHNHVRRGCHYHVRRGPVRLYESWFDSMSRWFDHELPQPRPTWLWLPRPFPPGSSSARRSSSAIHIHGGAGGDYPVCGCEQEYATLRTSSKVGHSTSIACPRPPGRADFWDLHDRRFHAAHDLGPVRYSRLCWSVTDAWQEA